MKLGEIKMKKNTRNKLPFFLLLFFVFVSQYPAVHLQASDGDTDKQQTFTVGFDAEFPPYGYKDDNGEYIGFDLDLAQEVCDRNDWKLKKQPIDWDSKDMELKTGMIDCIWNGFTINGRENDYTWSVPYVDNSQVVIVKKDSKIKELSDLAGKVVAVQTDSSALAAVLGYSKAQTFIKIIFPQICKKVMPPVTNEVITLVKDTSLAFAVAYSEMFTVARQIASTQTTLVPLFIAGVFYYIFNFLVAFAMEKMEKKLSYY